MGPKRAARRAGARLGDRKWPETCREACWSTAEITKMAQNVTCGVLQDFSSRWRSVEMTRGAFREIPGQAGNDVWKIPGQARNEERGGRNEERGGLGLCAFALEHGWGHENGLKRAARRAGARLGERKWPKTCRGTCWSTAGVTKWAQNVICGVLEHGWGNEYGPKRAARRATRFLHSLSLGRNDMGGAF